MMLRATFIRLRFLVQQRASVESLIIIESLKLGKCFDQMREYWIIKKDYIQNSFIYQV